MSPLFNWNTKQLFVYMVADYSNTLYVRFHMRAFFNEGGCNLLTSCNPAHLPCLHTAGELGRRVGPRHPLPKVRSAERARRQAKVRIQGNHRHFQVRCPAPFYTALLGADVVALSPDSPTLQQHFGDLFSSISRAAVGWPSPSRRGRSDRTYSFPACSEANAVDLVVCAV